MRYGIGRFLIRQQEYNPLHDEARMSRGVNVSPWGLTKVLTGLGAIVILLGSLLRSYEALLAGGAVLAAGVLLAVIQAITEETRRT